jgi:hypothetical protein
MPRNARIPRSIRRIEGPRLNFESRTAPVARRIDPPQLRFDRPERLLVTEPLPSRLLIPLLGALLVALIA